MRIKVLFQLLFAKEPLLEINGSSIHFKKDSLVITSNVISTKHELMFLGCTDDFSSETTTEYTNTNSSLQNYINKNYESCIETR